MTVWKKVSSASLNNNSTEGRVLSVKPKRLHLDKNESRQSRSAESRPGWSAVCNLGDDRGKEDVMQRRRRNAAAAEYSERIK